MTKTRSPVQKVLALDAGGPGSMAAMQLIKQNALEVEIIAADMDAQSPARLIADTFLVVPPADNSDYAKVISDIIREHNIDMVIPSFHFGLRQLSTIDSNVFVHNFQASLLCQDKWLFYKWGAEHNYNVPETKLLNDTKSIIGKVYIKPRFGAGSKNNYIASSINELEAIRSLAGDDQDYLVQRFIDGEHWSIETMRLDNKLVSCSTLRVVNRKSGNTTTAYIEDNKDLTQLSQDLLDALDYQGPANIDIIKDKNGRYFIIELNPRFGSTIQFTAAAGSNTVAFLLTGQRKFLRESREGYHTCLK